MHQHFPIPHVVSSILASAQSSRTVVQDYCPLAESLEWQLGERYLQERGNRAFINDPEPVPFTVNNDGTLSRQAAHVLFASLEATEQHGSLEPDILVLELGIGVGLFARFFLDAFQELCEHQRKDYYHRLLYVAGDYSLPMLRDAVRHGLFQQHPGRYVLRAIDALNPQASLALDPLVPDQSTPPFRAVFLNYLLDCLPATVLQFADGEILQLGVQTCLARGVDVKDFGSITVEELKRLANSPHPAERSEFRQLWSALVSEYSYRPVDPTTIPQADFVGRLAQSAQQRSLVHNYGAIQSLERLLGLLRADGFILINDYGQGKLGNADDFQHQRYSQSTFVGINFPLLQGYFTQTPSLAWIEPEEDPDTSIHARLLGKQLAPETIRAFQQQFHKDTRTRLQQLIERARLCVKSGRFEMALPAYQQALTLQPANWPLMEEVAHYLAFVLRNPVAGLEMSKAALSCNPSCSPELWNTLGDCLYELGRVEESRHAFLLALRINPNDVRGRYNLAFVHIRTREFADGLQRIAEALALDKAGTYRDRLLQKQSEILALLAQRHQQEYQRLVDRVSTRIDPLAPGGAKIDTKPDLAASSPPAAMTLAPPAAPPTGPERPT